ncbi:DUF1080 domain-containing protein [bacterium]|nr:DUF1080 domain-containing protein [bacterium]
MRIWLTLLPLLFVIGCQPAAKPSSSEGETGATETSATASPDTTTAPASESLAPITNESTEQPALEAPSEDGHNRLTRDELSEGWLRLFDGHTLFGWKPNSETNWRVENGVIVAEGEVKGLLCTTTVWANFHLKCDVKLDAGGNSGLFLRTPLVPQNPVTDCYELNVCDSHPEYKSASLVGRAKPMLDVTADGDWHTLEAIVNGDTVIVKFDDQEILTYVDDTSHLQQGFIGLQMNGGHVEFRDVFLRPLEMTDLFDGETLTGWHVVPGSQGKFDVEEGTIHVTGAEGRGFLETDKTYGNFVLQFEALSHGDALNSGVFFRAIEGTEKNPADGYEFQIQNGIKEGDRTEPADFGTGAIFRRVAARRVISNDHEWFTATLVANGPHFTTWVDGVQVVDWTDDRPANENPRQGLRLEPGHLSLQSHDPTTDLQFRNLRISALTE